MPDTHLKLMIPGPIEVEDDVLEVLGAPVQVHYGDAWVAIHNETLDLLRQGFKTSGKMFILPGSGNLGNDAALQSLFAPGDHVAVGINGNFGLRLSEILKANGIIPVPVEVDPSRPLDPAGFERALADDPAIVGVAAVHLGTAPSIRNPGRPIDTLARNHHRLCLIDAAASPAGTEFALHEQGIDV